MGEFNSKSTQNQHGNCELKPCPFCGGVACQVYSVWGEGYRYGCLTSGCIGNANNLLKQFKSDKEAIEAWNTRTKERGVRV